MSNTRTSPNRAVLDRLELVLVFYKLYLLDQFVEHEDEFEPIKDSAVRIGDVKTFGGFLIDIPEGVDVNDFNTVLVWCEAFGEFITAAQYQ